MLDVEPGWNKVEIPLTGTNVPDQALPYTFGFNNTLWNGIAGDGNLDLDAIKVQTRNELDYALVSSRENSYSTLIEILVDVEVRVPGYDAWWDVPVAETSKSDKVTRIRKEYEEKLKKERDH